MGSDAHHRLVRFALRGGHITSFTVNGTMFPNSRLACVLGGDPAGNDCGDMA